MAYSDKYGEFFGRHDEHGNIAILHVSDGAAATRLDASVYPVLYRQDDDGNTVEHSSELSARYEHAQGIALAEDDANRLGIEIEA